jgi:cation diffusion facilitator CzcD-associated flavoprotein CzcO
MFAQCPPTKTPDDIDITGLKKKYADERDKRIRVEGWNQYQETKGDLSSYQEVDPYTPAPDRKPISEDIDVAILGGGFAGLLCGARLKQRGVNSIRNIDAAGDFGGVWYWNRYPGVQCDNDAACYLPLLEETNYVPRQRYSYGPEIFEHSQRIGKTFGLYEGALFGTYIRSLRWDDKIKRWHVSTNFGDDIRARFVIMAAGSHSKAKLPGIPGIRNFKGHTFHTSRWDYEYTGGDTNGGLTKLADKRVAIIGTGATAIQCVPFLGKYAKHLYVFQRTPSTVDDRGNRVTDPEWAKSLKPGWQAERQQNFQDGAIDGFKPDEPDLICDGWTELNRNLQATLNSMGWPALSTAEFLDVREKEEYRVMERLRRRVDGVVNDKDTAEKLKAWYRWNCKRPCYNDDYLPTFNRPNVTLVDVSATKGVERITEKGVVGDGKEYEVDCIVYASGFEFTGEIRRAYGVESIDGRGGWSLFDNWAEGYRTLHGTLTRGFPNLLFTGFTQGAFAANITLMYDQQARHIAHIVDETMKRGIAAVEPTQEAQDGWVKTVRESSQFDFEFWQSCTPGLYNNEGVQKIRAPFTELYGAGFDAFEKLLEDWRTKGDLADFEIVK